MNRISNGINKSNNGLSNFVQEEQKLISRESSNISKHPPRRLHMNPSSDRVNYGKYFTTSDFPKEIVKLYMNMQDNKVDIPMRHQQLFTSLCNTEYWQNFQEAFNSNTQIFTQNFIRALNSAASSMRTATTSKEEDVQNKQLPPKPKRDKQKRGLKSLWRPHTKGNYEKYKHEKRQTQKIIQDALDERKKTETSIINITKPREIQIIIRNAKLVKSFDENNQPLNPELLSSSVIPPEQLRDFPRVEVEDPKNFSSMHFSSAVVKYFQELREMEITPQKRDELLFKFVLENSQYRQEFLGAVDPITCKFTKKCIHALYRAVFLYRIGRYQDKNELAEGQQRRKRHPLGALYRARERLNLKNNNRSTPRIPQVSPGVQNMGQSPKNLQEEQILSPTNLGDNNDDFPLLRPHAMEEDVSDPEAWINDLLIEATAQGLSFFDESMWWEDNLQLPNDPSQINTITTDEDDGNKLWLGNQVTI